MLAGVPMPFSGNPSFIASPDEHVLEEYWSSVLDGGARYIANIALCRKDASFTAVSCVTDSPCKEALELSGKQWVACSQRRSRSCAGLILSLVHSCSIHVGTCYSSCLRLPGAEFGCSILCLLKVPEM